MRQTLIRVYLSQAVSLYKPRKMQSSQERA